jgi:hypothetical protein
MTEIEELVLLVAASMTIGTNATYPEATNRVANHAAKLLDKVKPDWQEWYEQIRGGESE